MKQVYLIVLLFCFVLKTESQNLVPNPSFEKHTDCSTIYIYNALDWCSVNTLTGVSAYYNSCQSNQLFKTPYQYFDACMQSYQIPHSGVAYIDIGTYVQSATQESIIPQVKLIDTLTAGKVYCVTYYVSVWNNANYTIDKLGALLTPTPFSCWSTSVITPTVAIAGQYSPQIVTTPGVAIGDTLNWTEVSGTFTAVGNEAYLTLGDFFLHNQHFIKNSYPSNCNGLALYYVDDVSVELVEVAKAKNDTLINQGDSTIIGLNNSETALFSWQPSAGLSCTNCPNPNASPSVTTTYTVTKTQCKAVTSDVITVSVNTNNNVLPMDNEQLIPNVITPNGDKINDVFKLKNMPSNSHIIIYNRWGIELLNTTNYQNNWPTETITDGVYYYIITTTQGESYRGSISVFK